MEERVYQGQIYRRAAPGQEWQLVGPAQQTRGRVIADPYRAAEEARKKQAESRASEDQAMQRQQLGISQENAARSAASDAITNPQTLRKEYASLPEIKAYRVSTQQAAAALGTGDNPQGDIALTYAYAKVMDPDSVVRDQENNMVTSSQPWFQSAVENIKKQFGMDGAGNFTPETRRRLRHEIMQVLSSRKALYEARRAEMASVAEANGIDPKQVIGGDDTQVFAPNFRRYAEKEGDPDRLISALIGGEPITPPANPQTEPLRAAGAGATEGAIPIPPEMQREHQQYLASNWGKIDPRDYTAFRINLDRKYGFSSDPEAYAASVPNLNDAAIKGAAPGQIAIPSVRQELSGFDQFRNNLLSDQYGIGAGVAAGLNAGGFGIPSYIARGQMDALRDEYPVQTFLGDIAGGVGGTAVTGGLLKAGAGALGAGSEVASILANPLAGDIGYGTIYGATQADDPVYGALGGALGAFAGNRIGRAIGGAFPKATGFGGRIRALDESVPTSEQVKQAASDLYSQAEARGLTATGDETLALADTTSGILAREGRMSPTGRLTEVQPKVKEAQQLIQDYAGSEMTPKQIQTVRGVIADGLSSQDASEKRIARLLLDNFDQWTDATNPDLASGLAEARGMASRYLQGDKIAQARELADVRAGQFSNSGQGNALRTDFRQLDRSIAKGQEIFSPEVSAQIADVARGNPVSNSLRWVGRFAPTGPVAALPTLLAAGAGGSAVGPLGAVGGLGLGGLAYGARQLGQGLTERSAQVAENMAYGGPQYAADLAGLLENSAIRGGHIGAAANSEVARALLEYGGY
ncbi:hypothetical protein LZK98_11920 [Sphingomonas cannabina]|uniref:hypothetical protein n=1 Tax=Sphingomonas cannabina TaxID=2899123 RepID=UPI001F227AA4|nr:hypothetical protein [Sphingomonas cannabina]UIJ43799.1 hypothetical protein LZK98_11920 [Sphingomonas cannabina]